MKTDYKERISNIPDISQIGMPDTSKWFKEAEESLEKTRLEMEQYRKDLEESGNIRNYTDTEGFQVKEVLSKDGTFKYTFKSRCFNGNYESRTTIWKDGEKIRDNVTVHQIENTKSGGCFVTLVAILVIIIAVIGVISIF